MKFSKQIIFKIFLILLPILITVYFLYFYGSYEAGREGISFILEKYGTGIDDRISSVLVDDLIQKNFNRQIPGLNWFSNNYIFKLFFIAYIFLNYLEIRMHFNRGNLFFVSLSSISGIFLCNFH